MTGAVSLRLVRPSDAEAAWQLLSDMNVLRYMLFAVHTRQDAERYVREARPVTLGPERYAIDRAILSSESEGMIGLCGLVVDQERQEAEAWYMVAPALWGRGVATAALRLLLAAGFDHLGLHRVWACVVPENAASARVLEKAGMRREGHSLRNLRIHGEWCDSLLYAILREEWEALRGPRQTGLTTLERDVPGR